MRDRSRLHAGSARNQQHFTRAGGALYFENIVKKRFGIGAPDPAVVEEALGEFRRWAAVLNERWKGPHLGL